MDYLDDEEWVAARQREYLDEIGAWDWTHIKGDAISNPQEAEWPSDPPTGFTWIGSVYAIMPSGKFYTFWTSNQTDEDMARDQIFMECLESIAESHGMWLTEGGEDDHLYLGCEMPTLEEEDDDDTIE